MRETQPTAGFGATINTVDAAASAFTKARREAVLRGAWARARHSPSSVALRSFEDAKSGLGGSGKTEKIPFGKKEVAISKIVGSVSRSRDFDNLFLPLNRGLGERWKKVYRAFQLSEAPGYTAASCPRNTIPPVTLYRIAGEYFVEDGNHRVSVARFRGRYCVEAEVILVVST